MKTLKNPTTIFALLFVATIFTANGQDSTFIFKKKCIQLGISTNFDFDNRNLSSNKNIGKLNSNDFKLVTEMGYFLRNNLVIYSGVGFHYHSYNNESENINNGKSQWSYMYNGLVVRLGIRRYINISKNKLYFIIDNRNSIELGKTIYNYHISTIEDKFANEFQIDLSIRSGFCYKPTKYLLLSATMNFVNLNYTNEYGNYNDNSKGDFFKISTPLFPDLDISIHYLFNSK